MIHQMYALSLLCAVLIILLAMALSRIRHWKENFGYADKRGDDWQRWANERLVVIVDQSKKISHLENMVADLELANSLEVAENKKLWGRIGNLESKLAEAVEVAKASELSVSVLAAELADATEKLNERSVALLAISEILSCGGLVVARAFGVEDDDEECDGNCGGNCDSCDCGEDPYDDDDDLFGLDDDDHCCDEDCDCEDDDDDCVFGDDDCFCCDKK